MGPGKLSIHTHALAEFCALPNKEQAASKCGGTYHHPTDTIYLKYLGHNCQIDSHGHINCPDLILTRNEQTLIRQYITQSTGAALRHQWISFLQLPDGPNHHVPFKLEAIDPLAKCFAHQPPLLLTSGQRFGGHLIQMADCAVSIPVFPKVSLALAIWSGDEEFPANANVLFDANAPLHLTTACLWVLGVEVVQHLTQDDRISYL